MLLSMASGHSRETFLPDAVISPALLGVGDVDVVAWCFAQEPDGEPGSVFAYNQLCPYLVAAAVQKVTGRTLVEWLRPRLFEPLGIGAAHWVADNFGREIGFSGLHVGLDAVLALGQLYLDEGRWGDERLLPASWFEEARRPLTDTKIPGNDGLMPTADWSCGYGYQLWTGTHGYRGDGAFGQFMLVLPEQDAVVAVNSAVLDMQALLGLIWTHLLPGMSGPGDPAPSGDPLTLTGLRLRDAAGAGPRASFASASPTYTQAGVLAPIPVPVRVLTAEPRPDGWRLDLTMGDETISVPAGDGDWAESEIAERAGPIALAATAGWQGGTFHARVTFVTTPHTIELAGDPRQGALRSRWTVPPLHTVDPLDLGLPR